MENQLGGGAKEAVEESEEDSITVKVREIITLANQGQIDKLGISVGKKIAICEER